jgi:hypothetical protein
MSSIKTRCVSDAMTLPQRALQGNPYQSASSVPKVDFQI